MVFRLSEALAFRKSGHQTKHVHSSLIKQGDTQRGGTEGQRTETSGGPETFAPKPTQYLQGPLTSALFMMLIA